jgi:hypothetical protein
MSFTIGPDLGVLPIIYQLGIYYFIPKIKHFLGHYGIVLNMLYFRASIPTSEYPQISRKNKFQYIVVVPQLNLK